MTGTDKIMNRMLTAVYLLGMFSIINGCTDGKAKTVKIESVEKHEAQIQSPGAGMIYADKIACDAVMRNTDSNRTGAFHCYLVGFIDSLGIAKAQDKKTLETGKYYQFDVQNDWMAMIQGDSVMPVFYQPKQRLESHRNEGVLVFEMKDGKGPDTLIYKGSSSNGWGPQQLVINSIKK
jgi:hypothetical protein